MPKTLGCYPTKGEASARVRNRKQMGYKAKVVTVRAYGIRILGKLKRKSKKK